MKKVTAICFGFLSVLAGSVLADDLLIKNATIYTMSEMGILENGYVLVRNGRIRKVGTDANFSTDGRIIDAKGKALTPGLVNAYTHLGLVEIDAVSHSLDVSTEDTLFGPSFAIAPAFNPASTVIPHNRINGLTHAIVAPATGHQVFAGYGATVRLAAGDNALLDDRNAMFINFTSRGSELSGGSRASAYARLRQSLLDAREFAQHKDKILAGNWREYFLPLHDLKALVPVIKGKKPVVISVHRANDIRLLVQLKKEFNLDMVLAGVSEGWLVAEELAAAEIPVIIDPMANLPLDFDQLGARLDSAARMHAAGVTLLFTGVSWRNTHSAYSVRQAAGNAAAYGLPVEEALRAMTLNPARVFGFDQDYGSIDEGKIADLVLWDGHPLELLTRVEHVLMAGKDMPLVSRATRLRDRYRELDSLYPHTYRK